MYGFHGWPELYSLEVGRSIEKEPPQGVETLYYNPKQIGKGLEYWKLSDQNQRLATVRARREARRYLRKNYPAYFVIDLHDTPMPWDDERGIGRGFERGYPQFMLDFPDWNTRLGSIIHGYRRRKVNDGMRVYAKGDWPGDQLGYHSSGIEFFPMLLKRDREFLFLSKTEGVAFVKDFIREIRAKYLREEA